MTSPKRKLFTKQTCIFFCFISPQLEYDLALDCWLEKTNNVKIPFWALELWRASKTNQNSWPKDSLTVKIILSSSSVTYCDLYRLKQGLKNWQLLFGLHSSWSGLYLVHHLGREVQKASGETEAADTAGSSSSALLRHSAGKRYAVACHEYLSCHLC